MAALYELTACDKLILLGSKLFVEKKELEEIENLIPCISNWEKFLEIAIVNGTAPLLYKNFQLLPSEKKIPEYVNDRLKQTYYKILSRNIILVENFKLILDALQQSHVEVIALKGTYLSQEVYHDLGLRPLSDIDLLIKKEDSEKARSILKKLLFKDHAFMPGDFIEQTEKHLAPLTKNGVTVELHLQIENSQYGHEINTDNLWNNAETLKLYEKQTKALSSYDLLEHLCIHLDSHIIVSNFQLRHFYDIVNLLHLKKGEFDWDIFEKNCIANHSIDSVTKVIFLAHKFINAPIPDSFLSKYVKSQNPSVEEIFILTLRNDKEALEKYFNEYLSKRNLNNLNRVKGLKNKIKYLLSDIFPTKAFMIQNYKIANKNLYFFYYVFRWYKGFTKLLSILSRSVSKIFKK